MTKASTILVTPVTRLRDLPQREREIVSRFLFDCIKGLDDKHDRRWRRLWRMAWHAEPGEVFHILSIRGRSGPFHRRHMALMQRLFDQQEQFVDPDALRDWVTTGAGWVRYEMTPRGAVKAVPKSLSYEECTDDEMKDIHVKSMDFLRTPRALRKLWPHIPASQRAEMLDIVMNERNKEIA